MMEKVVEVGPSINPLDELGVDSFNSTIGKAGAIWDALDTLREATSELDDYDLSDDGRAAKQEAICRIGEAYEAMERVITNLQHIG